MAKKISRSCWTKSRILVIANRWYWLRSSTSLRQNSCNPRRLDLETTKSRPFTVLWSIVYDHSLLRFAMVVRDTPTHWHQDYCFRLKAPSKASSPTFIWAIRSWLHTNPGDPKSQDYFLQHIQMVVPACASVMSTSGKSALFLHEKYEERDACRMETSTAVCRDTDPPLAGSFAGWMRFLVSLLQEAWRFCTTRLTATLSFGLWRCALVIKHGEHDLAVLDVGMLLMVRPALINGIYHLATRYSNNNSTNSFVGLVYHGRGAPHRCSCALES